MSNGYIDPLRSDILNPYGTGILKKVGIQSSKKYDEYVMDFKKYDMRQAINRFTWVNLPNGLDSQLMERILYFRDRGAFVYVGGEYYFLPFTLNSNRASIDVYGRYIGVSLMTFNGSATVDKKGKIVHEDSIFLGGKEFSPVYKLNQVTRDTPCVLIFESARALTQTSEPLVSSQSHYTEELAENVVLIDKNLSNSVKQFVIVVKDEAEVQSKVEALQEIKKMQLSTEIDITFVKSNLDIQELKGTQGLQTQDYWEAFASKDSLRQQQLGIKANGVFNKKERKLEGEQELEDAKGDLVEYDGYYQRKLACMLINNTFGLAVDVIDNQLVKEVEQEKEKEQGEEVQDNEQEQEI